MKVLYVAPRFHTNQIPVVSGWLENGHQVMFVSQFAGTSEDYSVLEPAVLGYSVLFEGFMLLYSRLCCRGGQNVKKEFDLRIKLGFPPFTEMMRAIKDFAPGLVIVRERSLYNIPVYLYCRYLNIPCLLYNQSPVWDYPDRDKGFVRRVLLFLLPRKRITPVFGVPEDGKVMLPDSYFVPFVIKPRVSPGQKIYFSGGKIHVLCVGRYEDRKRLFMLVEAMKELFDGYGLELVIAGEAVEEGQKEYYGRLAKAVTKAGLEKKIRLLKNLSINLVYEEYEKADLFVLPSTKERASVSQLEAMSCSVPVICSDTNGSACYVENGKNGYLFRDDDVSDLRDKIEQAVINKDKLRHMGELSYKMVQDRYSFKNYYDAIVETGIFKDCNNRGKNG